MSDVYMTSIRGASDPDSDGADQISAPQAAAAAPSAPQVQPAPTPAPALNTDPVVGYLKSTGASDVLAQTIATNVAANPGADTSVAYTQAAQEWAKRDAGWKDFMKKFTVPMQDAAAAENGDTSAGMRNDMRDGRGNPDLYRQLYGDPTPYQPKQQLDRNLNPATPGDPVADRVIGQMNRTRNQVALNTSRGIAPAPTAIPRQTPYERVTQQRDTDVRVLNATDNRRQAAEQRDAAEAEAARTQRVAQASAPVMQQFINKGINPVVAASMANMLYAPLAGNAHAVRQQTIAATTTTP